MNFIEEVTKDIVTNTCASFSGDIEKDPQGTLCQIEGMLRSHYVRYGNDMTGRGIVGDSTQEAAIAGLEAVRVECLERIESDIKP